MRKTYSKEFKIEIVRKIANNLTTVGQVAKEYHISFPIVSRWVAEFNRYGNQPFRKLYSQTQTTIFHEINV